MSSSPALTEIAGLPVVRGLAAWLLGVAAIVPLVWRVQVPRPPCAPGTAGAGFAACSRGSRWPGWHVPLSRAHRSVRDSAPCPELLQDVSLGLRALLGRGALTWSCPILGRPAGRVAGLTGEPRRLLSVPAVATSQTLQAVSTQAARLLPESQPLKPELQHPVPTSG